MLAYLRKVMRNANDRGASAVEYALMVAAIAAVIIGAVVGLGSSVEGIFQNTTTKICTDPQNVSCATTAPAKSS
jgi:pilus assembly protein Flp/PilA